MKETHLSNTFESRLNLLEQLLILFERSFEMPHGFINHRLLIMCDPNLSWHASLFFETWSHARQTQQHEMLRGRQGWRYDDAKPELEGTNVRPKKFSSPIIRVPVIHCISMTAVRWTQSLIDLCSYIPALWSRSTRTLVIHARQDQT